MSRSHRQISHPKEIPREPNSTLNVQAHARNKSLETRNFDHLVEKGRELYHTNQLAAAI